jgi:hypothetical protein
VTGNQQRDLVRGAGRTHRARRFCRVEAYPAGQFPVRDGFTERYVDKPSPNPLLKWSALQPQGCRGQSVALACEKLGQGNGQRSSRRGGTAVFRKTKTRNLMAVGRQSNGSESRREQFDRHERQFSASR